MRTEVDGLIAEAIELHVRTAETALVLAVAVNYACMHVWFSSYRQAKTTFDD